MSRTSVVIPHGGDVGRLLDQLDALARQTVAPDEIVVSCNHNGGRELLSASIAGSELGQLPLTLLDSSATPGPSGARNAGWRAAIGDLVLFCDDDDVAESGWVAALEAALDDHDLVGGALAYDRLNSRRAALRSGHARDAAPTKFGYLPYAPSANLGAHREVLETIGGFDEALSCGEDIDLCWRAQRAGFGFAFVPEAIMHYRLRSEVRKAWRQSYLYGVADAKLLLKHRAEGVRRSARETLVELAGIPLAVVRAARGRGDLVDVAQRIGGLLGRIVGSVRHRVWCV